MQRPPEHHPLVKRAVELILEDEARSIGQATGAVSGARRKTSARLKAHIESTEETLFPPTPELYNTVEEIYKYPLQETARDTLSRQLRSGISDDQLSVLVIDLRADNLGLFEQSERGENGKGKKSLG